MPISLNSFFKNNYWNNEVVAIRKEHIHKKMKLAKNTVPIIIKSKDITINSEKLLVPKRLNLIDLQNIIRRKAKLNDYEAIFLFVNGSVILKATNLIEDIYNAYKKEDDILYVLVSKENTFGFIE